MRQQKVQAAVLREFGRLEMEEFPYPDKLEPGSLMVKMLLAGICGTDKHIYDGKSDVHLPLILGHENLAQVERLSAEAPPCDVYGEPLKVGDRITWFGAIPCGECWYCRWLPDNHTGILCSNCFATGLSSSAAAPHLFGGYAEKVYLKPGMWIWKIPEEMPDEVAVLTDILASVSGVVKAMTPDPVTKEGFGPGDHVAIQGAGPIGLAAGITAKLAGAYRIAILGAPKGRMDLAARLGIFDRLINIDEVRNPGDRVRTMQDWTPGGVGPDLVVDCTGVPDAVPEGLDMVRRGGSFVEIGSFVETGETSISPFRHLCWKDVRIIGQYGCSPHYYERALRLLEMGWKQGLPLRELVSTYPLARANDAMRAMHDMKGMKIALDMR